MLTFIPHRVPSGLAASGSLVSGVTSANQITNQTVNGTLPRGTTTMGGASGLGVGDVNSMVLNVGYSMVRILSFLPHCSLAREILILRLMCRSKSRLGLRWDCS